MKSIPRFTVLLSVTAACALNAASNVSLKEVTVSANKMEENIKDVAQSISVMDENEIEQKRIKSVKDAIRQIPNMHESLYVNKTRVNFRGVNQSEFTNSNPVTVYIDGIPTSSTYGRYDAFLTNVERIEILRGPQAALYGKDSIGGVINVISKQPQNKWSGGIGAEYGSYNYISSNFDANGALIDDKLFLSLSGAIKSDDGWIKNEFNGDDKASKSVEHRFSVALTVKPTDRLTARLTLAHDKDDSDFFRGGSGAGASDSEIFYGMSRQKAKHANSDLPTTNEQKSFSQALAFDYEFDAAKFSSITTHKKSTSDSLWDSDFANLPQYVEAVQFQDLKIDTLTQEFKISNSDAGKFKWIGGVYFEREKTKYSHLGGEQYLTPMLKLKKDTPSNMKATTAAAFGQVNYEFIQDLTFSLGGRYQKINKKIDEKTTYSQQLPMFGLVDYEFRDSASWTKFLPKIGIIYRLNDDLSVFANYSQGYLTGGYNYFAGFGGRDENKFGPQTSDNYELGLRGNAFEDRLKFAATLFHMDIKDIHIYKIINSTQYVTANGGKAKSDGIELEATYQASSELEISGALGINKTKYKQNSQYPNAVGKKIENTPAFNANLGVSYVHPSGVYARADLLATGATYFDAQNLLKQGSWVTLDLRLGYRFKDFDVYAFATNVTDKTYVTAYMGGNGYGLVQLNDPRRFGLGVRYSF